MHSLRKSRFIVESDIDRGGGEVRAVYQTMTKALVLLDREEWSSMTERSTPSRETAGVELLCEQGILVRETTDETALFEAWKDQYVNDFSTISSKVLVTRKCNNRCRYCIVDPEAREMTRQAAKAMDLFYMRFISGKQCRRVKDAYSGGEALLNAEIVLESASRRSFFCMGRNIEYSFGIITNGTLLSPSLVTDMKEVGLNAVRVSLAGPAAVHDKLRPLRGGGKTYELIMENLESVSGLVPIAIECQYDSGSSDWNQIPVMLDDFERRGIAIDEVIFTPIMTKRKESAFQNGMGDPAIYFSLVEEARGRGYVKGIGEPSNACMADFKSKLVFDTDGSLIPCPGLQSGELVYGSPTKGIDFVAHSQILKRRLPERCLNQCELLPVCTGGCRLQAMTNGHGFNGVDCHYDVLRLAVEDHIRIKALEAMSASGDDGRMKEAA